MKKLILYSIILSVLIIGCIEDNHHHIYVSPEGGEQETGTLENPLSSIEEAIQMVSEIRNNNDEKVTIHLDSGDYHLTQSIQINPQHSNISIVGSESGNTIIKGSKVFYPEWTQYDENIWVCDLDTDIIFSQLYINGKKQILARYPNYDPDARYWNGHAEDAISRKRVSKWKNPRGGIIHAMHKGKWGGFHYKIEDIDDDGNLQLSGGHQNNRPSKMHEELRMVENVFAELDSEKEWYYDQEEGRLYLWPDKATKLENATVEISQLKHLIEIIGTPDNVVQDVSIKNLDFQHTQRTLMESYHPLLRSDWTIYRGGAILLDGTKSCNITACEFSNLGGNVIFVNGYNRGLLIEGNHIHHCGASAISFVGDSTSVRSPSFQYSEYVPLAQMDTVPGPANDLYPSDCEVVNNLIYNIGQIEKQVAGVQISMSMKIKVKNNTIYDVPRAGINVSEGTWGGHLIEYNDVFNTVLETSDHGAFNSWGRDRFWHPRWNTMDSIVKSNPQMPYWDAMHTTIIRNNRFRCDHGWDIDLDDGSSNYHIYNNLCLKGGIKLREGYYRKVENNIMINNSFHPHVWFSNSDDIFRNNILMTKYFPIRLAGWGKEVDDNLFPDSMSLDLAQKNNTDKNSTYGDPQFLDPTKGNFRVRDSSPALDIGFTNFTMDSFGVQKPALKAIAKKPEIPNLLIFTADKDKAKPKPWLGGTIKDIETKEEQSAYGLNTDSGAIIITTPDDSKLSKSNLRPRDVVIQINGQKINNSLELMQKYEEVFRYGQVKLLVVRDQQEVMITIKQ